MAITYNGDEIGMVGNFDISFEESQDTQGRTIRRGSSKDFFSDTWRVSAVGCACGPDEYLSEYCSRDPERTPVLWTPDDSHAGFTDPGVRWRNAFALRCA